MSVETIFNIANGSMSSCQLLWEDKEYMEFMNAEPISTTSDTDAEPTVNLSNDYAFTARCDLKDYPLLLVLSAHHYAKGETLYPRNTSILINDASIGIEQIVKGNNIGNITHADGVLATLGDRALYRTARVISSGIEFSATRSYYSDDDAATVVFPCILIPYRIYGIR